MTEPTDEELKELAESIIKYDMEHVLENCQKYGERPICLSCGEDYRLEVGYEPAPLCDTCAHTVAYDFATRLVAFFTKKADH